MKNYVYSENDTISKEQILEKLLYDNNDPRSRYYVRTLNRPSIRWFRIIVLFLGWISLWIGMTVVIWLCSGKLSISVLCGMIISVAGLVAFARRIVICCVKIYQRYAPDRVRNKCRFEPSCSEYMIMAVRKYGALRGVRKGIRRLRRCNLDGGGYDYP